MEEKNNKPRIKFARQTARNLLSNIGINNPPILLKDIVNHIKKEKDLSVYSWAFGDNTDGIQITTGDVATIGYNKNQHPHRQRFTIAHEIGHLLLGHTGENLIFTFNSKDPKEIEASQFAAELLMPLNLFKENLLDKKKDTKELSFIFNVSEEAVWWRINNCKLLNKI